jgi:F0F1-type ATP synthase delta subunit
MSSPSRKQLAEAVLKLSQKYSQKTAASKLAAYLVRERRSGELDAIMREAVRLRQQRSGTEEVTLTSRYKLSEAQKKHLAGLFGSKKAVINEVINDDVVGGVRLESSDRLLDLTVRSRLNSLKGTN